MVERSPRLILPLVLVALTDIALVNPPLPEVMDPGAVRLTRSVAFKAPVPLTVMPFGTLLLIPDTTMVRVLPA